MGIWAEITGAAELQATLDAVVSKWHSKIWQKYIAAAKQCYQGSQADAPVGLTGDLKGSGEVEGEESGVGEFYMDVSYGADIPFTGKDYDYAEGESTSAYPAGDMMADKYVWMVELGHLSRAGNPVPPRPFLGPNFDIAVEALQMNLEDLLS